MTVTRSVASRVTDVESPPPRAWRSGLRHVNDGPEVFVVLGGAVDMHYRDAGGEHVERLTSGRICYAEPGDEHVAHPDPQARILVVERNGSI